MAVFKDNAGRTWLVSIDVAAVERIHAATEVRIDKLAGPGGGLDELLGDPVRVVRVLWVLCEPAARASAITPEAFAANLGGDSLEDAGLALVDALADFSPRHLRAILKAQVAKGREVTAVAVAKAVAEIEAFDPFSTPATPAAECSGSTPAPPG